MISSYPAYRLDGKTPVELSGQLEVGPDGICFDPDHSSALIQISWSEIESVESLGQKVYFHFYEESEHFRGQSIVCFNSNGIQEWKLYQASAQGKYGCWWGFLKPWMPKSFSAKVSVIFGLILVVTLMYLFGMRYVYHLVPDRVDVVLGNYIAAKVLALEEVDESSAHAKLLNHWALRFQREDHPFELKVHVIQSEEKNAFALPGGQIFFYSSLLDEAESEEEIIGILAHETAHVYQRHGLQNVIRTVGTVMLFRMLIGAGFEEFEFAEGLVEMSSLFMVLTYSREFEREADQMAKELCIKHSVALDGLVDFFERHLGKKGSMGALQYLHSHPSHEDRVKFFKHP